MERTKVILVTGASDGIGAAAARRLARDGHAVIVVGRSPEKTKAVAASIGADHFVADFTRLDDVRRLAADLNDRYARIDVLANNAGGVFGDRAKTVDGFEKTFQINHLAPFLLTALLMDKLIDSQASIIQTSTLRGGLVRKLDLDDLDHDSNYDAVRAYNAAKLENVLFTKELHRRYHRRGISAAAFYPGNVATNFGAETTSRLIRFLATNRLSRSRLLTTPEKGADQMVWLAGGLPGRDWTSGEFYAKRAPDKRLNSLALDVDLARGLWDRSEELLRRAG
ncbi:SDR family NAD(P)-dependent oxidoreductase [Streptomyces iranensis]|uniref:NAD(P)-dependent dehydrogenase (Short-subunit alcohol dehydrogenase family) n=1 Tax=Streptomyces iranensis TaxID=576784 RepID=A0A060ZWQ2_9ACTN|nr:SDR family NAD(P)-dependent oxidoreductase [Streptomyces iranensis]MBP2059436.1 NAD(P)-dependent dehydrogenase (short-subunit alcohol dehydrogenase family) [Streptomyces iranensis]CDR10898.1 short-chain dehydrogenase/reductase SDR [Streptomyces iranensis]